MLDSSENPLNKKQRSLFSGQCEVHRGHFLPYIDPEEADFVDFSCDNPNSECMPTCRHPDLDKFLQEVNGLPLDVQLKPVFQELPTYIPVFERGTRNLSHAADNFHTVGISITDIVSGAMKRKAGTDQEQDNITFNTSALLQNTFRGKQTILFLTGADTLIESLWYKRNDCHLFEMLRVMGFSAVTSFNFSVINGECAVGQALNQKKSLFCSKLLEENGIGTIPHFYASTSFQINRVIDWFKKNPSVNFFTLNCQLQKTDTDTAQIIYILKEIFKSTPKSLHVILQGFELGEIHRFGADLERIHFAEKAPVKFAIMRRENTLNLETQELKSRKAASDLSTEEIMIRNLAARRIYIELMREKYINKYSLSEEVMAEIKNIAYSTKN